MSSLIGFLALFISLVLNLFLLSSIPLINLSIVRFNFLIRISAILTLTSFFSLMVAYVTSDFNNFNVFQNSHSQKPMIYKISGTWGNHEGSMLLLISILSIYAFFFLFQKKLMINLKNKHF